jgi:hypothetical protein
MTARKKRHVVVAIECDLPPGVSAARFKQYLLDEAKANVGQLPTEDPLFDLDRDSVQATIIPRDIEWFLRRTAGGMDSPLYRRWFA